jgi:hypothetical protein
LGCGSDSRERRRIENDVKGCEEEDDKDDESDVAEEDVRKRKIVCPKRRPVNES